MEATTAERLEIHPAWLLWGGYCIGGTAEDYSVEKYYALAWNQLRDPMDLPEYNESHAFPSLKPSIDVFRPPLRSRKQRGWFQVRPRRAIHSHPPPQSPSSTPPIRRSGADVPPELFERILRLIFQNFEDVRSRRRALAKCGQVCRYWAARCRAELFKYLTLASRQDVLDFCSFKRDPACAFSGYVTGVLVPSLDMSEKPWVHHLTQAWDSPGAKPLSLSLGGPLPRKWKTIRSIHQALPQSLPPHFSHNISQLRITNLCFRMFQDLTHLVGELPHLVELRSEKVVWGSFPAMLPRQREHKSCNTLQYWLMTGCDLSFAPAALYLFMSIYRGASYFSLMDTPGITALVDVLESETAALGDGLESCAFYHEFVHESSLYVAFQLKALRLQLRAHPCSLPGTTPSFRLTIIAIEPEMRDDSQTRLPIDWAHFDGAADKFRFLRMVILGFENRERALRFAEEVVDDSMPLLTARGALRYAILPKNVWSWQQVSRESDVVKDSGMRNLIEVYA